MRMCIAPWQVDQRVFQRLVADCFRHVSRHLEELGADISCVFVSWFLCIFCTSLPMETCFRLWDVLFWSRSSAVLFRAALALLEIYAAPLLSTHDMLDAFELLQVGWRQGTVQIAAPISQQPLEAGMICGEHGN